MILLQHLLYDSLNVISRYNNKLNKGLWNEKNEYLKFKNKIYSILSNVEGIYTSFLLEIIELAAKTWNIEDAELIYEKWIPEKIPKIYNNANDTFNNFINHLVEKKLNISKLYLKTWLSLINTKVNTRGGKIE